MHETKVVPSSAHVNGPGVTGPEHDRSFSGPEISGPKHVWYISKLFGPKNPYLGSQYDHSELSPRWSCCGPEISGKENDGTCSGPETPGPLGATGSGSTEMDPRHQVPVSSPRLQCKTEHRHKSVAKVTRQSPSLRLKLNPRCVRVHSNEMRLSRSLSQFAAVLQEFSLKILKSLALFNEARCPSKDLGSFLSSNDGVVVF